MSYLLLIFGILVGGYLILRWFGMADARAVARDLRILALVLGVALVAFLVMAARWSWLWAALPFVLPWLVSARTLARRLRSMRGPRPGKVSKVETRFLRMTLDHDSGEMSGEVASGSFAGRRLDTLSPEALVALWDEVKEDEQSLRLLEAWLDRFHPDWRQGSGAQGKGTGGGRAAFGEGRMSREEAYRILDLEPGADQEAIRAAHRRLMAQVHPDRGGSDYLAAKINEAKEVLLAR